MAEDQDRASIGIVKGLLHRTDRNESCKCYECTAIKRVCILAQEAIDMKAARERKRIKQGDRHVPD